MSSRNERLRDLFELVVPMGSTERSRFLDCQLSGEQDADLRRELDELLGVNDAAASNLAWHGSALRNEARVERSTEEPALGQIVGRHRLVELIGSGGMGKVYRAVRSDSEYEQNVAIKRIRPGLLEGAENIQRFRAERQILANLEHPNIARLLEGGTDADGMPYLVMEYVEGLPPLQYCELRRLSVSGRLDLFRQICSAVHYAHQRMVVHRDLKPGNILVTRDGVPKLLDFGIAKILTLDPANLSSARDQTGMHLMTARYSSPEQVRGEDITTASDVYSLGVVLYELLTSESPYRNSEQPIHELMRAVCEEEPVSPATRNRALRGDLDKIILQALRKEPSERYASVDAFSEDLLRYLRGKPVKARVESIFYVTTKFIRRNKALTTAAGLLVLGAMGAFIAVRRAEVRAERRFSEVRELAHAVVFDYHDAIERLAGSTEVRGRLVRDALRYLDSLSREADSPDLQREMVDAYVRIANVQGDTYNSNLGNAKGALESARKGTAAAERLLRQDDSSSSLASAASAFAVEGTLQYSAGDLVAAERLLQRAVNLGERAAKSHPGDLEAQISLSDNLRKMADLYGGNGMQNLGKTSESLRITNRANAVAERLAQRFPADIRVKKLHQKTLLGLAAAETSLGHSQETVRYLRQAVALVGEISAANPDDSPAKVELANADVRLGQVLLDARQPVEAIPYIARAAEILERLTGADPKNMAYQRGLSVVENNYAAALRSTGDYAAALVRNRKSLRIAEAMSAGAPTSVEYLSDVGIDHRKLAETLLASGDGEAALDHSARAAGILCPLAEKSTDAYLKANCGRAMLFVGNSELRLNRVERALQALWRAEETAAAISKADLMNAVLRSDLARTESSLAAGLARAHREDQAREYYRRTAADFARLRELKALTAEDAHRAEDAERGFAALMAAAK